jgi:parallel beta-helix repeat protein
METHMKRTALSILAATALIAVSSAALGGTSAFARTVSCGDTITADTTLHHDLTDCVGNGLVIGADNIRLNLNGHTIDGNDTDDCANTGASSCDSGVDNAAGHSGVIIEGGTVQQFELGVDALNASHDVLSHIATSGNAIGLQLVQTTASRIVDGSATDNRFVGVLLLHFSDDNEIRNNAISGSTFPGLVLDESSRNRVERNVIEGNDQGIASSRGDHNDFRRNVVSHNLGSAISADQGVGNRVSENLIADNGDGITVGDARDTQISGNIVKRSGFFGAPDTGGFGILLDGSDNSDVERNVVVDGRGPGIFVTTLDAPGTSDRNVVSRNIANSRLSDGILVNADATQTLIQNNSADRNGHDGIETDAKGSTLRRNSANRNHDLGIEAAPGVIDGGGNHAFANGNPAQCLNIAC